MRLGAFFVAAASMMLIGRAVGLPNRPPSPAHIEKTQFVHQDLSLHIEGSHLRTISGREVHLHGVNIGGWLVTENWMCGFADSQDQPTPGGDPGGAGRSAQDHLEARFGEKQAAELISVWQTNWITERDLDQIQHRGFNLIRVPISYRTLQHADGSWILDKRGEIDFSRMDWIVRESARRGIYTVFDLHVWPEQRTDYEKIGRPEGSGIRDSMSSLWTVIATHYRGNGAIAAFDTINEFPGAWGVQKVLSRAIVKSDPARLQVVEGYTFAEFKALHDAGAFPNSIFSEHIYASRPISALDVDDHLEETRNSPVPIYIAEFQAEDFNAATRAMARYNVAWSSWTYKTVGMANWGLMAYPASVATDIQLDSYSVIHRKWSTELRSPNRQLS